MSVITNNTIQPSSGQALTIKDEGGTASITVATNGEATFAESIKITNGKGIDFSAVSGSASGSASAVLDDYEEGTYTFTLHDASSGGNQSAYSETASYIKIGRLVTITLNTSLQLTDLSGTPSSLTSTSTMYCSLPFTPTTTTEATGSVITHSVTFRNGADSSMAPSINQGFSRMRFKAYSSGDNSSNQRLTEFNGGYISNLTLSYFVD